MGLARTIVFRGGSHEGDLHTLPPDMPDTLFCVTREDGEPYARTSDQDLGENGEPQTVFRYDPDGSLTRAADFAFSGRPSSS
jgi:hypothetical protein